LPHPDQIYVHPYAAGSPPCAARLRGAFGRIFRTGPLRGLLPYLRPVTAVTEPAGRVWVHRPPLVRPAEAGDHLTVISANLWHDWPRCRRLAPRVQAFAGLVEAQHADLVLLQEVARTPQLHVDEWLAERLGMACVYARANGHAAIGFEEGLAILSRYPLGEPYLRQLSESCNPFARRLALGVGIQAPGGPLLAVSAHLGLAPAQNAVQLERLQAWVSDLASDHPALVGGDFNAPEGASQIERARLGWLDTFRALHPRASAATHTLRWPWGGVLSALRLDYIFLSPGDTEWVVLETRHLSTPRRPHSDHRAVLTRLAPLRSPDNG
jgi:endonuclease/exonuclease/phosphatase family metal-dependent hydrolase